MRKANSWHGRVYLENIGRACESPLSNPNTSRVPAHQVNNKPAATISAFDPLTDERWEEFLRSHPAASVFHTRGWLKALQRAYGFEPVAFTESEPGAPLRNALVFCKVASWITGKRLVSAPFSDHCDPLVNDAGELARLSSFAAAFAEREHCRYTEIRPTMAVVEPPFLPSAKYQLHQIDLTPGAEAIYARLHRDCIQRKIRRSQREKLILEQGNSATLLMDFYRLHTQARLDLGLPPQPFAWFEALFAELGERATVRVAFLQKKAVASIITLEFKNTAVYKYGCSDDEGNRVGGAQAVMWAAIEDACKKGHTNFDMGRSDVDQPGLIEYKERWGAKGTLLTYYRNPGEVTAQGTGLADAPWAKKMFSKIPAGLAPWVGRMVYKHFG